MQGSLALNIEHELKYRNPSFQELPSKAYLPIVTRVKMSLQEQQYGLWESPLTKDILASQKAQGSIQADVRNPIFTAGGILR